MPTHAIRLEALSSETDDLLKGSQTCCAYQYDLDPNNNIEVYQQSSPPMSQGMLGRLSGEQLLEFLALFAFIHCGRTNFNRLLQ
jgi:hypothetical protein